MGKLYTLELDEEMLKSIIKAEEDLFGEGLGSELFHKLAIGVFLLLGGDAEKPYWMTDEEWEREVK